MAKFNAELPNDLIKEFEKLGDGKYIDEMVEAGADVVYKNVKGNMSRSFKSTRSIAKGLRKTRLYDTPSDDGRNIHIGFYGYTTNEAGQRVPIPLIAMAREYGTSHGERKKPFFRKAFKKSEIEAAMKKVEDKYLPKE